MNDESRVTVTSAMMCGEFRTRDTHVNRNTAADQVFAGDRAVDGNELSRAARPPAMIS